MQSLSDDERKQALGEVLADELKAIHELVKDVPEMKQKIDVLDSDMKEVKSYIKVIKAAVTDISREQKEHDRRKTHLEAA
jgi:chromosome segregation ATPase